MIDQLNMFANGWMQAVWRASVQGGCALLVLWCICRFVPRVSPAFKVWLWRIVWFKLLLAFVWSSSIDLPLLSSPPNTVAFIPPAPATSVPQEVAVAPLIVVEPSLNPGAIFLILWLFGVLCCLIHLGYQWRRSVRLKRSAQPIANDALVELCSKLGIPGMPTLGQSNAVPAPVLIGFLRPTIIVPTMPIAAQELRMMLAHELAHLKRRDLLWAWLPAFCHVVFFFHPLLWLTRREWLLAQEMACDELALRHSSGSAAAYGNMLIDLAAAAVPNARFGTLSICETTQNLKRRILAMKNIGTRNNRRLMIAILIPIIAAILPWRIVAQDEPNDPAKRIERLEKENAELRAQLGKLKESPAGQKLTPEELRALEESRLAGEKNARDFGQVQVAAEISAAEAELNALRNQYTDRHPKVLQAQTRLQQLKERQTTKEHRSDRANDVTSRQRELYLEELALAQQYADSVRKLFESGRTTHEELFRAQQQLLKLKREIVGLDANREALKQAMQEEIAMVQRLLKETQDRVKLGISPKGEEFNLQRELLKLKRELLMLE
jgi:beta-lactamase regulating signal transducer with metallopeptidase domain